VASIPSDELVFLEPSGKLRRVTFPAPPEEKIATSRNQEFAQPGDESPVAPRTRQARRTNRTNVAGVTGPVTENGAQP